MIKNSVDYMLSLHVLKELKAKNLISEVVLSPLSRHSRKTLMLV
ncbi:MAG: hypothetical protein JWM44_2320 [Bacilli bacterium]|nr:hypothetical protein [Bacilli bacterium]